MYTVTQIKEIVKGASQNELDDLTEDLSKGGYPDKEVREIAGLIKDRLIEINGA